MKVGVVGAGQWGRNIVRTLHEMGALAAVAETCDETRRQLKELYPAVPLYDDHRALLESATAAVAVATPAAAHYDVAKECLLADKDVFVEKPLALNSREAEELAALAERRGRILMVGHLLLYQPATRWMKDFLDSGRLGQVYAFHQERLSLGRARAVENALWSLGVHDVALLLHLVGRPPVRVEASGYSALRSGVEDDVYLHLEFPEDVRAHLHVSWLWPEKRRRLVIVGSDGMLEYDELEQTVIVHDKHIGDDLVARDGGSRVVFRGEGRLLDRELEHFVECVRDRRSPLSDGWSGVEVVRILEQADAVLGGVRVG